MVIILLAGCSGCAQKTTSDTSLEAQRLDDKQQSTGVTPRAHDPILDVELERIELPPDFNMYYGKSYFGITENNQKPPSPDEYAAYPLFWIPGWEIRTRRYQNGEAESFMVLPNNDSRSVRYKERIAALKKEQGTLTRDDYRRVSAEVKSEGLPHLHAAKYLGRYGNRYALGFAEKAHEENPDDFHTLWVLTYLQEAQVIHYSFGNYELEKKYELKKKYTRLAASSY